MSTLVIGGSGFLGRALIRRLTQAGEQIKATSREADRWIENPRTEWHAVDLKSFRDWHELLGQVSTVYHLAWSTVPSAADSDPLEDAQNNIIGTLQLLEAIKSKEIQLIFASSGGTVYGNCERIPTPETAPLAPIGAYGISKATAEHYIKVYGRQHRFDYSILRFGNFYGPDQVSQQAFGAVANFCLRAVKNEHVTIFGDGKVVRDYLYIEDAVDALLAARVHRSGNRVFNVSSGVGTSLDQVISVVEKCHGQPLPVRYSERRGFDIPISVLDISLARQKLLWRPTTLFEHGIRQTLLSLAKSLS